MKRLLLTCVLALFLCGSAGAEEPLIISVKENSSGVTINPGPFNYEPKIEWTGYILLIRKRDGKEYEIGFRSDGAVVWRPYNNESEWIRIPPGEYLRYKDAPVPKNYHDWHLEGTK